MRIPSTLIDGTMFRGQLGGASSCGEAGALSAISTIRSPRGVSEICSTRRSERLMRRVMNPLSSRRQRSLEVRLSLKQQEDKEGV